MILSEKLYELRTASGLSQEELAEKMNVSRQSISKWENGTSIPGIDKILELSKFYGVTTDFLLQDEQEELPKEVVVYAPPAEVSVRTISLDEATRYISLVQATAGKIALGVTLCILSPIVMFLLLSGATSGRIPIREDLAAALGSGFLLCVVAMAVVLFIINCTKLSAFNHLEKEVFQLEYGVSGIVEKLEAEFMPTFTKYLAIGIALCVVSPVPMLVCSASNNDALILASLALLLAIVSAGVYSLVWVGMQKDAYSKLLQKGEYKKRVKKQNRVLETFVKAYWCIVTAIYLGISLPFDLWEYSWVIWPVAGVLYTAAKAIAGSILVKECE